MTIQTTNADMYPQGTVDKIKNMSYREGYLKALEDVQERIDHDGYYPQIKIEFTGLINRLKSTYEKEQNDGKD